ncbi:MAG: CRISPR-associated endonuclease Cas2 [Methanobrevibacter sp.]|uniref:CRISPR-associated endonuclease Cas2 n=1 Tax=Methanobrevibacter sp. TaxID=66852 RepID=UPI003F0ED2B0
MYTIVIFEVNFKTNKEKIENILRHFGLRKIQTNTYIGKLNNTDLTIFKKEIELEIRRKDSLLILPICDSCYSKKETFGREINFSENLYRVF